MEFEITIKEGEVLHKVKARYGTTIKELLRKNDLNQSLTVHNKYGKVLPESMPLRGPTTFLAELPQDHQSSQ